MPDASTKACSAAAPSDHHTPLPAITSGRSARASSAIASLMAPVSPSVRGDGFHAGAYVTAASSIFSPSTSPGMSM
jgi:hypothetical protein